MQRNTRSSTHNNMPLVYSQSNDENYPQITSMLRKTKRDETRLAGAAKRPALAAITNLQNVPSHSSDLGKQIRQRQANPFSIRVDTKKPSPKQKQIASRPQRTSCSSSRLHPAVSSARQSTLSAFRASTAAASSNNFSVFRDRNTASSSAPSFANLRSSVPSKASECPMSVERSRAPLAPPATLSATPLSTRSTNLSRMDVDEPSFVSDMSIDLTEETTPVVRDIDADANAVFDSPEYVEEIDLYLRKMEKLHKPRAGYMAKQRHISHSHRCTVVDWMYEVCDEFHMGQKTFELAVSYVDRFLSKMSMPRQNLQLLGSTALFIAYKVEETEAMPAARFVWITDHTYTVDELFRMECMVLNKLGFEMNSTTSSCYQDRFLKASEADCREHYLTEYLCDRALVHGERFLAYPPSVMAAAATALSRATFRPDQPAWTPTLAHYTRYSYEEIKPCMSDLLNMYKSEFNSTNRTHAAVWNRYTLPRYMLILKKSPIESLPDCH